MRFHDRRVVRRFLLLGLVVGIITLWMVLITPSSAPSKCIDFSFVQTPSSNGIRKLITITLSNCSDNTVEYYGGEKSPWYQIAYESNGVLCHTSVSSIDRGYGRLHSHDAIKSGLNLPIAASSVKVGLSITSLTWRGNTAWSLVGDRFDWVQRPVVGFLLRQDEKYRTKTEWSKEYLLIETNETINIPLGKH